MPRCCLFPPCARAQFEITAIAPGGYFGPPPPDAPAYELDPWLETQVEAWQEENILRLPVAVRPSNYQPVFVLKVKAGVWRLTPSRVTIRGYEGFGYPPGVVSVYALPDNPIFPSPATPRLHTFRYSAYPDIFGASNILPTELEVREPLIGFAFTTTFFETVKWQILGVWLREI
ncbi:MAG: hypothetical protein SFY81_14225 [Verrucomicrobiota bacterium]|nr:hypothetical protein [Verrucomicrobiota bacterium]